MKYTYKTQHGKIVIKETICNDGRLTYKGVLVRHGRKVDGTRHHIASVIVSHEEARAKLVQAIVESFQNKKQAARKSTVSGTTLAGVAVTECMSSVMRAIAAAAF